MITIGELMRDPEPAGASGSSAGASCPSRSCPPARSSRRPSPGRLGETRPSAAASTASFGITAGRPTPVTECVRLSERLGIRLLLKREDLTHTGSHKLNNVIGQALLAERMGKRRLIAETGAGQHGVAAATAAALLGLDCLVYMGAVDVERQALNVFRMELLGARGPCASSSGSRTLKDAINEALRDWVAIGRDDPLLHRVGGRPAPVSLTSCASSNASSATRPASSAASCLGGIDPDVVVACVGGGSNAAGTFAGFVDTDARLVGVEAAGGAAMSNGVLGCRARHAAPGSCRTRRARSSRRARSRPAWTIRASGPSTPISERSAGPSTSPPTTSEVLAAFRLLAETEGIIPALEPAHALAWVVREAGSSIPPGSTVLMTLSGRGDKDVALVRELTR